MSWIVDLCSRIKYENGRLFWVSAGSRIDLNGKQAGSKSSTDGYIYIKFRQKRIAAHRVVFFMHHQYLPEEIDHINRVRDDNRIENLRDSISHANNMGNQSIQKRDKSSSYKGVCWDKNRGKWMASIKVNRRRIHLGRFSDETLAAKAYNSAAISAFGVFANINSFDGEK